ncbi:MAG: DNA cytosine methyltransferase [Candidatus Nanohaloarchaea archaeon]
MKILNGYAGIGGNRKNWDGQEHDIVAVEINCDIADVYRDHFPEDTVVETDAHEYIRKHHEEFDFIWASPPCQTHSQMHLLSAKDDAPQNADRQPEYPDMRLYQEIIFLRNFFDGRWVVENVQPYYDPLIKPQRCGRHRIWANFPVPDMEVPRNFEFSSGDNADREALEEWLGIKLEENIYVRDSHDPGQVLRNAVHPKIGEAILKAAMKGRKQETLDSVARKREEVRN